MAEMKRTKIVRETKNFEKFERVGDKVEGEVVRHFESNTKYGVQQCIEIKPLDEGDLVCVGIGSNLGFYAEEGHFAVGNKVCIEYMGKEKNDNTGNKYKVFDVYLLG